MPNDNNELLVRALKYGHCGGFYCNGKGIRDHEHHCPYYEFIIDEQNHECQCCETCHEACQRSVQGDL